MMQKSVKSFTSNVIIIFAAQMNYILISIPQINIYSAVVGSIVCQFVVFLIEWSGICKYEGREIIENTDFEQSIYLF